MSKDTMSPKQKGYIGLGAMAALAAVTIWGSEPLYKAIDNMGKESIYTAGTYTGKAEGFGGEVIATVTVSDTSIESIELKGDGETEGIGTNAFDKLPNEMIGNQSARVDAVAGATITSDAAIKAVDGALALARGEEIKADTAQEETTKEKTAQEETTKEKTTQEETTKDVTEGTAEKAAGEGGEASEEVKNSFIPGTYTGVAAGYGGDITATVTVTESGIEVIELKGDGETEEIGGKVLKKLPEKMIKDQTADVDGISSATVTSDAAKAAVKKALEQAKG